MSETDQKEKIIELEKRLRHTEWKLALSEATARNYNMRDVLAACAKICEGSVFFLDKNLRVSYMGGSSRLESPEAGQLVSRGTVKSEGSRKQLSELSASRTGHIELSNGDHCWAVKIDIMNVEIFYIVMFTGPGISEEDVTLLFGLVRDCFNAINLRRRHGDITIGDFQALISAIIDGRMNNWDDIDAYAKRLPDPPKRFINIAVVESNPSMRRTSTNALISKLKSLFPGSSAAQVGDFIVIMISSDTREYQPRPRFNESAMNTILNDYDAYIAFSNATQRLDMIRTNYVLTESTLRLGRNLKEQGNSRVFYYEDYAEYISIEMSLEHFRNVMGHDDLLYLTSPDAVEIYRYDQQHGTDLQLVLYQYCKNNGNMSSAAKDSYMHRNTFAARMAQIKEILKRVDLSDGRVQQRMLYSCRVFRYYNLYYDKKSAKSLSERLSITQS